MNDSGIASPTIPPRLVVYATVLATIALYWAGLNGPFLLDDLPNLSPLQRWHAGTASAMELIFGNTSGLLGRPVSMATLWFSAATGGLHPFPFKLGNLLIHIACGLAGWQLLRRLLEQDAHFAAKAGLLAAALAGLWLLHPINVSTVLYAVQRMAQLSALFVLLSVLTYVLARQQLIRGEVRGACIKLFALFPLCLLLGAFSKENAIVAPALCLVVELGYFLRQPRNGKALPLFFTVFLLIPAALALWLLITEPGRFLSYAGRDFSLIERVLSQPRALMEYLGLMLWPRGGLFGIYMDDFRHSTGLLAPVSTLLALLGLLGISALAIALRRQAPAFFTGWFFFLVAHGVESGILPLELYFEHRNYLPGLGIALAATGLLAWLADKLLPRSSIQAKVRAGWVLLVIAALAFAAITWQQARVWRSEEALAAQAVQHRPDSLRAVLAMNTVLVNSGRLDEARRHAVALIDSPQPRHRFQGNINTLIIDCLRGTGGDPTYLRQAENAGISHVTYAELQAWTQLGIVLDREQCAPGVTHATAADSIERLIQATPEQSGRSRPKWLLRSIAAGYYRSAEDWEQAQRQAELAWYPDISDPPLGAKLVDIHLHNGNKAAAQRILDQVRPRVARHEYVGQGEIERLQREIDQLPD